LGDEVGQLNAHSCLAHPSRNKDSRWVGRPFRPDDLYEQRHDESTQAGQIFAGLKRMIDARRAAPGLAGNPIEGFDTANPHVLGYMRGANVQEIYVLANFADTPQDIAAEQFIRTPPRMTDLITGESFHVRTGVTLAAHQILWLC